MKSKLPYKITLLLNTVKDDLLEGEYLKTCRTSHIVAVKQKRGYSIVKHLWEKVPMNFKNRKDLLEHLSIYM